LIGELLLNRMAPIEQESGNGESRAPSRRLRREKIAFDLSVENRARSL
jgi:hypothetical protein